MERVKQQVMCTVQEMLVQPEQRKGRESDYGTGVRRREGLTKEDRKGDRKTG